MTQARPIVHVGYHKTGTTWFQKRVYPLASGHECVTRDVIKETLLAPHAWAFDAARTRERLTPSSGRTPILCEENLSGDWRNAGLMGSLSKEVADRLAQSFDDACIVIFVRNQVDMLAAIYAQYLKSGGSYAPQRLFFPGSYKRSAGRLRFKRPSFQFEHFDYLGLIRHYEGLFGRERVFVYPYEAFREEPHRFLIDYCDELGLDVPVASIDYGTSNASFRHWTLRLGRLLNHFTPQWASDKRVVAPLLSRAAVRWLLFRFNETPLAGRRLSPEELLGSALVDYVRDYYAAANRALVADRGLDLQRYGYPLGREPSAKKGLVAGD